MKTINTSSATTVALNGTIEEQKAFNSTKSKLSHNVSSELERIFGVTSKILSQDNSKEIISMETDLSKVIDVVLPGNNVEKNIKALNNPEYRRVLDMTNILNNQYGT